MSVVYVIFWYYLFFFFNDPAPTEIYTLPLHDALPILVAVDEHLIIVTLRDQKRRIVVGMGWTSRPPRWSNPGHTSQSDRKSTRLNSSHSQISYAVFCLKKKKH